MQGDCTFANPSCLSMLGYEDVGEVLGRNMHELSHHTRSDGSPYPVQECRIYEAIVKGKGTHVDDEVLWHKDGTSFAAEYWAYPVYEGGKVTGAVVTFWDISERRQSEEALRHRLDELERYQKATVSREFRIKELRDEIAALKKDMDVARDEGS
jgi:PAS domain S-box-containing protein